MIWIKKLLKNGNVTNEIIFGIFWDVFIISISVIIALKLAGISGIALNYFWIVSGVFIVFAIITLYQIQIKPKDTRLDDLIELVKKLQPNDTNIPDFNKIAKQIDDCKKLKADLDNLFKHLSDGDTTPKS